MALGESQVWGGEGARAGASALESTLQNELIWVVWESIIIAGDLQVPPWRLANLTAVIHEWHRSRGELQEQPNFPAERGTWGWLKPSGVP